MSRTRSQAVSACLRKRLSQGKEKVSGSFGYLALGGPGRWCCPGLTLHEELHSLAHLSRNAQGCARISRMQVSVQDGRAVTVVLNPSWYFNQTPFRTGCIPKRSFQEYGTERWSPSWVMRAGERPDHNCCGAATRRKE
jgi:hypothetical protein